METRKKAKRIIVVLGMHRSGTSVIARGLSVLGVELGQNLLPPQADNVKGFWEDKGIVEINTALMSSCGKDWKSFGALDVAGQDAIRQQAIDYVREALKSTDVWGFKDPRTARLLPFWQSVFNALEITPSFCLVMRHPLSVAKSLELRDSIAVRRSALLWYQYSMDMLNALEYGTSAVVDYDKFLEDSGTELKRIARGLQLEQDISERACTEYFENYLTPGLRHSRYDLNSLSETDGVPGEVSELYHYLLGLTTQEQVALSGDLRERLEIWKKNQEVCHSLIGLINDSGPCEEHLQKCRERLEIAVKHLEQTLKERDAAHAEAKIHEQRHQMAVASLEKSQEEVEVHKQMYRRAAASLDQKEKDMEGLRAEYSQRNEQLDALLNSTSWRITTPLRALAEWLRTVAGRFVKRG